MVAVDNAVGDKTLEINLVAVEVGIEVVAEECCVVSVTVCPVISNGTVHYVVFAVTSDGEARISAVVYQCVVNQCVGIEKIYAELRMVFKFAAGYGYVSAFDGVFGAR